MAINWISENNLLVAGHDCVPMIFKYDGNNVTFSSKLEKEGSDDAGKARTARDMFKQLDSQRTDKNITELSTTHQNTITLVIQYLFFVIIIKFLSFLFYFFPCLTKF